MGKGSGKAKKGENETPRKFYTFTLNSEDPSDKELIDFLNERSTTASVKDGLRLLKKEKENGNQITNQSGNTQDVFQLLSSLANNKDFLQTIQLFSQLQQNQPQIINQPQINNNEQAATVNNDPEPQEQELNQTPDISDQNPEPIQKPKKELSEEEQKRLKQEKNKIQNTYDNFDF
jgi:hypothetical protein